MVKVEVETETEEQWERLSLLCGYYYVRYNRTPDKSAEFSKDCTKCNRYGSSGGTQLRLSNTETGYRLYSLGAFNDIQLKALDISFNIEE